MTSSPMMVYVTTSSNEEARTIAYQVVSANLAACANIFPNVESIYRWKGKVHNDQEAILVLKTMSACVTELTTKIKKIHSYDCPCVVALPIEGGNKDFLDWIDKEIN